ncbi:NAD(P)(+) transhydrogenase (Re/Si-specific) subunit beta [Spirochaeta dissipatitropha]
MDLQIIANLGYVVAAVFFIVGLKRMSHPRTAVQGNLLGALGMFLAVVVTLLNQGILNIEWILIGIAAGTLVGTVLALKIQMTAMPQLVGLFNGFGGIASVLVAAAALYIELGLEGAAVAQDYQFTISIAASGVIGAITFFGSVIAFGKLQGIVTEKPVRYPGEQVVKVLLLAGSIVMGVLIVLDPSVTMYYWIMAAIAGALGLMLVLPIGGADMPIVIALLNSYSGIAAAATGFVLTNTILIVAGSLVGASGIILTRIMCKAMNRSLANVLFGGVGAVVKTEGGSDIYTGKVTSTSPDEVAMILKSAQRVVFVPGYGMAVARAQTAVRQITEMMEKEGIEVVFGIHPVAGRMPGHMNVLLAEENISYDKLLEMDQVNPTFAATDVVIVLGANDVVNPVAREPKGNPIAGMPILDVDQARTVVVIKRSLSPGFAGIDNPLFAADNTLMLFGDGKKVMDELVVAYKEV